MQPRQLSVVIAAIVMLSGLQAQRLMASTVEVGTCLSGLTHFSTIQAAVNAVPAGSTVEVCPGTYPEQVTITQALTLKGVASGTADMAVITSPAGGMIANFGSYAAGVVVSNTASVNISNLVVDGSNNGIAVCSNPILAGILYTNASGTIKAVVARNQSLSFDGCSFGTDGIRVRSDPGLFSSVSIQSSTVHHFQSLGIYASGTGTAITIKSNSILGVVPSQTPGNGIDVAFGATGVIQNNIVFDEAWAPDVFPDFNDASWGILVECAANTTVSGNTVGDSQGGIVVSSAFCGSNFPNPDNNNITSNKVFETHLYDAINVCGSNNLIQGNTLAAADQAGVHLVSDLDTIACPSSNDPGNNNTVSLNTINDAGCGGIIVDGNTSGNILSTNTFSDVVATILNPGVWCGSATASAVRAPALNWRGNLERALR